MAGLLLVGFVLNISSARACGTNGGFLPENTMKIPVPSGRALLDGRMTEDIFNSVIEKARVIYAPVVSSKGGRLNMIRDWNDGTVNAYADREGNTWNVKMYGGLARHQAVTADGFAVVVCHELGHHLGGVPRYPGQFAANEGQADYFATLKCLRRVWEGDDNVSIVGSLGVPQTVTAACEKSFSDAASIALCQRTAMAGLSSANLSKALDGSGTVSFTSPDANKVSSTYDSHPRAQCRLDTYYNGSLCQVKHAEEIGQNDPTVGVCSMEKNDSFGYRPQCWYKPGTGGGGGDGIIARQPTLNGQAEIILNNPNQQIAINFDVSNIQGATGVYVEIVGPNRDFAQPNGTNPDAARVLWGTQAGTRGHLVTRRSLTWGVFKVRIIALGGNGDRAVSRFSNGATIRVQPRLLVGGF